MLPKINVQRSTLYPFWGIVLGVFGRNGFSHLIGRWWQESALGCYSDSRARR